MGPQLEFSSDRLENLGIKPSTLRLPMLNTIGIPTGPAGISYYMGESFQDQDN